MTPAKAAAAGIAFVPAKRLEAGCIAELSIRDNITFGVLDQLGGRWYLSRRKVAD